MWMLAGGGRDMLRESGWVGSYADMDGKLLDRRRRRITWGHNNAGSEYSVRLTRGTSIILTLDRIGGAEDDSTNRSRDWVEVGALCFEQGPGRGEFSDVEAKQPSQVKPVLRRRKRGSIGIAKSSACSSYFDWVGWYLCMALLIGPWNESVGAHFYGPLDSSMGNTS